MNKSPIRVLVVDDYEPWRRYYATTLSKQQGLEIIGEALNGLEAVQRAQELQPDLIFLDIGLPILNGIEAARRIREVSPASKILFVSENRSADIAGESLNTGALGYVVKSDAARELLPAVEAVLQGKLYLSIGLARHDFNAPMHNRAAAITHSHEVAFYADDTSVVDGYVRFVESSLKGGNAVIVVVTESHRASLLPKLGADGVDVPAATVIGDLIMGAARGVKGEHARVVVCGEIAPTLLSKGNAEGAIKLEHLWDEITRGYGVHTLCGYPSSAFLHHEADPVFQRICAVHSAVHGQVKWPLGDRPQSG